MLRPTTALVLLVLRGARLGTQGRCGGAGEPTPSPTPEPDAPFGLPVGPHVRLDTAPVGAERSLFPVVGCDGDAVHANRVDVTASP